MNNNNNNNNSAHNNNNNNSPKIHPPISERDIVRQLLELELAGVIAAFEADERIAVHTVDIERLTRDERGGYVDLKTYPLREDPHAPVARVRVAFAEGPLVSATALAAIESAEPPETIEEATLRLAREADLVEEQEEAVLMTAREEFLYGGRYA